MVKLVIRHIRIVPRTLRHPNDRGNDTARNMSFDLDFTCRAGDPHLIPFANTTRRSIERIDPKLVAIMLLEHLKRTERRIDACFVVPS